MRKAIITVRKDKCPLDILAGMGGSIANSWIYLHVNCIEKLKNSEGVEITENLDYNRFSLRWEGTEDFPETYVVIEEVSGTEWTSVYLVSASDIQYNGRVPDPDSLYFLKMGS